MRPITTTTDAVSTCFAWSLNEPCAPWAPRQESNASVFFSPFRMMLRLTEVPGAIDPIFLASSRESLSGAPSSAMMTSPAATPALAAGLSQARARSASQLIGVAAGAGASGR